MAIVHDIISEFPKALAKGEVFAFTADMSKSFRMSAKIPYGTQIKAECDISAGSAVSICSDEGVFFCTLMENAIPTSLDLGGLIS